MRHSHGAAGGSGGGSFGGNNQNSGNYHSRINLDHGGSSQPHYRSNQNSGNQGGNERGSNQGVMHQDNGFRQNHRYRVDSGSNMDAGQGGNVSHHHAYSPSYVQHQMKDLGVRHVPEPIANRSHILDTDRKHSTMHLPSKGFEGRSLGSFHPVATRAFSGPVVRTQMGLLSDHARLSVFIGFNASERESNHYYWHHDVGGWDYCHYYDPWGYHWYGWYIGSDFFWTRYYSDRWWFYDPGFGRWCYWNDGFWWWQDPYHVTDVYVYHDGDYVPASSSDDQPTVSTVEPANPAVFRDADNTRLVKIMGDSRDAFLYDTAIPPNFSPLYLASKVENVKFSDTSSGKPLQIMLTLQDGTFDIFDEDGLSMNFSDAQPDEGQGSPSGPGGPGGPPPRH
jgi:hypothetical protein